MNSQEPTEYVSSRDSTKPSGTTIIYQNANTGDENSSGNDDKSTESPSTDNNDSSSTSSNNLIASTPIMRIAIGQRMV